MTEATYLQQQHRYEMIREHHRLNGHEFEQTPGDSERQGSLVCCSSWGCKESDMTEPLISNNKCVFTNLYKAQWITSSQDKTTGIELSD